MRIDRLELENFKCFSRRTLSLHPHFTLLVGDNGTGKTTLLDALAVAAGVWLVKAPDSTLINSGRNILPSEIRLVPEKEGDRTLFREMVPAVVRATGTLGTKEGVSWMRQIHVNGQRTSNLEAKDALNIVQTMYEQDEQGRHVLCPILGYYGAGRAWLPSNERPARRERKPNEPARRWAAFYDCFNERIRFAALRDWFRRETTEAGNRGGKMRPGFQAVRRAILRCIPEADGVWFDADRGQIVLSIGGNAQPFDNLSAGQRMMLALVADLAIKAVTQNTFLVPGEETEPTAETLPKVLGETPGLVLIDELDVHLHPRWQRRVASDLKSTFPAVQFVCTSHSPQVIGEVQPQEVRVLQDGEILMPERSFGIDSSRVLEEMMGAKARNEEVTDILGELARLIDDQNFSGAREKLRAAEAKLGPDDPEITRARTLMKFLGSGDAKP